jgi:4-amino-4-deoxy-L-arabinose transferase-like glycosyltransferase
MIRNRSSLVFSGLMVFLAALGVRLLLRQEAGADVWKIQTGVVNDYWHTARLIVASGPGSFFNPASPLSDTNLLGHPPGYPILLALIFRVLGESSTAIQLLQITLDALSALIVFLIAKEFLETSAAVVSGLLVALAPQFTWNSVLLLPDTLSVVPILLAIYFLAKAYKNPRLEFIIVAGACVGLSCWLRANALLLAPFMLLVLPVLFRRGQRLRFAAAFLGSAIIVIAPMTVRNWIVFHHFIPVSLGAGQTMLEGIGDYDPERRFGIPNTDMELMKMEAEELNRPDYYGTLWQPEGIKRDRMRISRWWGIVRANPAWFLGVMIQRGASMLRLERARRISTGPPVTYLTLVPRFVIGNLQNLFITAIDLPLILLGAFLLFRSGKRQALAIFLIVPAYYVCIQSAVHTEYRYVLAVHYFLFILAAVSLTWAAKLFWKTCTRKRAL